jgi:hypothetical protein
MRLLDANFVKIRYRIIQTPCFDSRFLSGTRGFAMCATSTWYSTAVSYRYLSLHSTLTHAILRFVLLEVIDLVQYTVDLPYTPSFGKSQAYDF